MVHSSRSLDKLIELLQNYQITLLIDIRRFPGSNKFPHFNRETLKTALSATRIDYIWMGKELGGFRSGGYENYMLKSEFQQAVEQLIALAKTNRVAIMCAEALWFRCHRRFVADYLVRQNVNVIHIFDERHCIPHKLRNKNGA
ncbi:MAG: DUF488 domain-containing protein [Candidatus Sumerlaeia bacterium]|nr:DUF488 domain-containing protein [Candidatus Sumerlaeia bacterium]